MSNLIILLVIAIVFGLMAFFVSLKSALAFSFVFFLLIYVNIILSTAMNIRIGSAQNITDSSLIRLIAIFIMSASLSLLMFL